MSNRSTRHLALTSVSRSLLFQDILTHWLKLGISGFRLANTQYLTEDPNLRDESRSILPVESNNYQSLVHIHTRNRPENAAILMAWRELVHSATDGKGYIDNFLLTLLLPQRCVMCQLTLRYWHPCYRLFALQDDIGADMLQVFNQKDTLIDLPQSSHFLTANASILHNATILHKTISQWIEIAPWPAWNVSVASAKLTLLRGFINCFRRL